MIFTNSIHNYLKNLEMQQKWQKKYQGSGDMLNTQGFARPQHVSSKSSSDIQNIINKLNSGKKLSAAEKAYLLKNNPSLYQKAVKIEREREDYARELKRCKTKQQALNAYMSKMQSISADFKRGGGSESAGDGQMRFMSISEEHKAFINSKEYKRLPDEKENTRTGKSAKGKK